MFGIKKQKLYESFIKRFIPDNIEIYCEPFGGHFSIFNYLQNKPKFSIYNDINHYDIDIKANKIYHLDYKEIFQMYNTENVVWYIDPPYLNKEHLYQNCDNYTQDFHYELRDEIEKLKGKVILSYEDKPLIRYLYKKYNINIYDGSNQFFKNELIITL